MKKIIILLIAMFTWTNVSANTINDISMDIYIDINGTAHVKETWDYSSSKNTEIYHQYLGIDNSSFSNYTVTDSTGKTYDYDSSWNISGSFDDKMYKNGINYVDNGVELCLGISHYGNYKYTLSYDISNFVSEYSDAQIAYWTLLQKSSEANYNYNIKIYSDFKYSDTSNGWGLWGYGVYGDYAYIKDGVAYLSSSDRVNEDEHVTFLLKFPLKTFTTTNKMDGNFASVLAKAEEGSEKYVSEDNEEGSFFSEIISFIPSLIPIIICVIAGGYAFSAMKKYKFGPAGKNINMKEINNFRDIPCNKDVFKAFFLAQVYSLNKVNTDFFGTLFLKWLNENKIKVLTTEEKKLFGTKESTQVELIFKDSFDNEVEKIIYDYLIEASKDNVLEENELKKWSKKNYNELFKWFDKAEEYGRELYVNDSLVSKVKTKYLIDDRLKDEAIKLAGLKKFLLEFSAIETRQAIEVKLWKEYLMFAQIFGIADKVAKQFKNLYPEILTEMTNSGLDITDIYLINSFSNIGVASATSARSAAQSYSGGGGGFSSGGGGGGSFGGGGSMGSR